MKTVILKKNVCEFGQTFNVIEKGKLITYFKFKNGSKARIDKMSCVNLDQIQTMKFVFVYGFLYKSKNQKVLKNLHFMKYPNKKEIENLMAS
jgi:hypothetical protein